MKPDNTHRTPVLIYMSAALTEAEQNRLIIGHMDLVEPQAAKFRGRKGIPFEDLVASGRQGLVMAARSWSPPGNFVNYAEKRIWGQIFDFVEQWRHLVPVGTADEIVRNFHEWDIWGGAAPYEKWTQLSVTPEELLIAFDELSVWEKELKRAWRFLPKMEREVIELRFFRDPPVTLNSIAREFEMPYATLVDFINRTIKRLAEDIGKSRVAATPTAMRG